MKSIDILKGMLLMLFLSVVMAVEHSSKRKELNESLIPRIANGDTEAFSELYETTKTAVYSFALSIVKNAHDAQDIMQETYLKIHANAIGYFSQGKPMAWIFTIVRNLCLMHLRKSRKSDVEFDEAIGCESPVDFTQNVDDNELISMMMTALSEEERSIVIMHVVSGMKHREISEILEIPLSTVLSKYNRALHKMKKHFDAR